MDIDPLMLLRAYASGVFPMSDDRDADDIYWVEPKARTVMPLDRFHLSRSLARTVRRDRFVVSANRAFARVISLCAQSAPDRPTTWINHAIEAAYGVLHARGFAHSIECWDGEGALVGGLYGVSLGKAFFGESMFSRANDGSKVAMAWLVARLRFAGFVVLDCQFMTDHLRSLGAIEISRQAYSSVLSGAVSGVALDDAGALFSSGPGAETALALAPLAPEGTFRAELPTVCGPVSGHDIAQFLTQMS